jgi:putative DNA primase/helicase
VRSALVWLGEDDPVVTMEKARENDPCRVELATVMNAWAAEIGTGRSYEMTAAELLQRVNEGQIGLHAYPRLREAIHAAVAEKNLNSKSLGRWLAKHADKISDGLKLKKIADPKHGNSFYLDDPGTRLL